MGCICIICIILACVIIGSSTIFEWSVASAIDDLDLKAAWVSSHPIRKQGKASWLLNLMCERNPHSIIAITYMWNIEKGRQDLGPLKQVFAQGAFPRALLQCSFTGLAPLWHLLFQSNSSKIQVPFSPKYAAIAIFRIGFELWFEGEADTCVYCSTSTYSVRRVKNWKMLPAHWWLCRSYWDHEHFRKLIYLYLFQHNMDLFKMCFLIEREDSPASYDCLQNKYSPQRGDQPILLTWISVFGLALF